MLTIGPSTRITGNAHKFPGRFGCSFFSSGYDINDQVIKWFWECIRSWPPERKSRLLQFATGTSRIPVNGFKDLQGSDGPRRFTIEKSGDPQQLPKSHTCFNRVGAQSVFLMTCLTRCSRLTCHHTRITRALSKSLLWQSSMFFV